MESESGICAHCTRPHPATVSMGDDVFVHSDCESAYLRRVLGRNLVEKDRKITERLGYSEADDNSNPP